MKTIFNVLKLLTLLHLGSCSHFGNRSSEIRTVEPIPQWLKVAPRFAHRSEEGYYATHAFFDFIPLPDLNSSKINFVLLTPEGSRYGYDINLHSGQIYKRHKYCPQTDTWKSTSTEINLPPYSEGFVPRILDQLGDPLKIIVYGENEYLSKSNPRRPLSQRVRVVGGVIQQYCENFPCSKRSKWLSRLVLVAVNHLDSTFKDVTTIKQLKSKINWGEFKAFIENGYGRLERGKEEYPAFRLFGVIDDKAAFKYALKKGHLFKFDEMKKLRNGCHRLYDHLWKQVTDLKLNLSKKEFLRSRSGIVDTNSLIVDLKKSIFIKDEKKIKKFTDEELEASPKGPITFKQLFNDFYNQYGQRFKTCNEFVRTSNALKNKTRHWFFTYMEAFMNLEELGYIYHCSKRVWIRNSFAANGKRQYDKKEIKKSCSSTDLETSFDTAITLLYSLKKGNYPHYFYSMYDQGHGGSHNRLFSWVKSNGKNISCKLKKVDYRNEVFFPLDINWKYFHQRGL
ncbi:MAG: hypothetical protein HN576_01500 [Bacteriovoracaceae bacterium]|nr:hypothetical protein [Bacteriovoracaceae bacterium]